jgi:hypothetical protein
MINQVAVGFKMFTKMPQLPVPEPESRLNQIQPALV